MTTVISSLYIILILMIFYFSFKVCFPTNPLLNYILTKNQLLTIFILVGILNYILFVRSKKILKYNFKEDKTGGYLIFIIFILIFIVLLIIGQKNRDRIVQENERIRIEKLK